MRMLNRLQRILLWGTLLLSASLSAHADPIQDANKLFKQGNSAQALEKIEQFLVEKPKSAPAQFLKGLILTEQNKTEEAIKVFTALNENFPELPEPYNNLAVLYAGQGQYEKAKVALEMAIHAHPSYATAHENLGDIYAKLASQSYDRVLQLDHNNVAAKSKLAILHGLFQDVPRSKPAYPAKVTEKPVAVAAVNAVAAAPAVSAPALPASAVMATSAVPIVAAESAIPAIASSVVAANAVSAVDPEKEALKARNSEVMSSVNAWVSAWENKQTKRYLAFYAGDFHPSQKGLTRAKWAEQRRSDIDDSKNIQISISRVTVNFTDDTHATVKFQQALKFGKMRKAKLSRKTLSMVKPGDKWLILQEVAK